MKKKILAILSVCAVIAFSGCSIKELDDKYGSMTESELESVIEKELGDEDKNSSADSSKSDGSESTDTSADDSETDIQEDIIPLIERSEDLDFSYFEIGESKFNIKFDTADTVTYSSVVGAVEGEDPLDGWKENVPFTGIAYSTELDGDGKGVKSDTSSLVYFMEGREVRVYTVQKPKDGYPKSNLHEIAGVAVSLDTSGDTDIIFADGVKVGMKISEAEGLITGNEYYGDNIRAYKDRNEISLIMHVDDNEIIDRIYLIRYKMSDGKE